MATAAPAIASSQWRKWKQSLKAVHHILLSRAQIQALPTVVSSVQPAPPYLERHETRVSPPPASAAAVTPGAEAGAGAGAAARCARGKERDEDAETARRRRRRYGQHQPGQ
jgi:hypothetical protein